MTRLLRTHGTVSLFDATESAVNTAQNGFAMTQVVHDRIKDNAPRLAMFSSSAELYLDLTDLTEPKAAVGEIFRNPDLVTLLISLFYAEI
jgi:gamma-glutamyltranspeptidase